MRMIAYSAYSVLYSTCYFKQGGGIASKTKPDRPRETHARSKHAQTTRHGSDTIHKPIRFTVLTDDVSHSKRTRSEEIIAPHPCHPRSPRRPPHHLRRPRIPSTTTTTLLRHDSTIRRCYVVLPLAVRIVVLSFPQSPSSHRAFCMSSKTGLILRWEAFVVALPIK